MCISNVTLGERERDRRQYSRQVAVFKSVIYGEENGTQDQEETVQYIADSVASVGESGVRERCLGASVASLGAKNGPLDTLEMPKTYI